MMRQRSLSLEHLSWDSSESSNSNSNGHSRPSSAPQHPQQQPQSKQQVQQQVCLAELGFGSRRTWVWLRGVGPGSAPRQPLPSNDACFYSSSSSSSSRRGTVLSPTQSPCTPSAGQGLFTACQLQQGRDVPTGSFYGQFMGKVLVDALLHCCRSRPRLRSISFRT